MTDAPEPAPAAPAPGPAPEPTVDDPADASLLALLDRLTALLEHSDLTELEVAAGGTSIVLRKPSAIAPPVVAAVTVAAPAAGTLGGPAAGPDGAPTPVVRPSVKAPLTGIWYGSPSPGSAPFMTVGGEVGVGQVVGLIEAMKLFNEIKSDLAGRVVRIHAEDGKLVKAKQPLIEVEPL